jgi:hypothetical protein
MPCALGQGHLAAETADGLGHLGVDLLAAEDQQAARDCDARE